MKNKELFCEEHTEATEHLHTETLKKKMTKREKKIKKEVDMWKKLRYENMLLQRKRKRDEMKVQTNACQKISKKLDREYSNLQKRDQDACTELLSLKSENKVMQM
jgi:hypothetical protein